MNKSELIDKVAEAAGLSKTDVDESLKAILNIITGELAKGNKVTLVGFGTFERRKRKARMGVNPQNPTQKIKIAAKNAPAFSPGSELKQAVQTGKAPALQLAKKKIAAKKAVAKASAGAKKAKKTSKK